MGIDVYLHWKGGSANDADAVCAPEATGIEMPANYPDDFEKMGA
jgi:hypothetical protein